MHCKQPGSWQRIRRCQCGSGRRAYDSLDAGTPQALRGRQIGCPPWGLADNGAVQAGLGDLANATVGLVGFGNIGRAVAERLQPFGSRLLYTARHAVDPTIEQRFGMRFVSLDDLLACSTIVSLQNPLTEATRGLIGEAKLAKMSAGAFLINTSRGEVLNDAGLSRRALVNGKRGSGPRRAA